MNFAILAGSHGGRAPRDAAAADVRYDGLSLLFTTAPRRYSGDELFTKFKEQNYIELLHHQMKTPLAVRPVFLKSPRRVEALVTLLQIALQAYQVLERRYRQTVPEDAPAREERTQAEALFSMSPDGADGPKVMKRIADDIDLTGAVPGDFVYMLNWWSDPEMPMRPPETLVQLMTKKATGTNDVQVRALFWDGIDLSKFVLVASHGRLARFAVAVRGRPRFETNRFCR